MTYSKFKALELYYDQEIYIEGQNDDGIYTYLSCVGDKGNYIINVRNEFETLSIPLKEITLISDADNIDIEKLACVIDYDIWQEYYNKIDTHSNLCRLYDHEKVEERIINSLPKKYEDKLLNRRERLALVEALFPSELKTTDVDYNNSLTKYFHDLFYEMYNNTTGSLSKKGKRTYYYIINQKMRILEYIATYILGYGYSDKRLDKMYEDRSKHTDSKGNKVKRRFNSYNYSRVIKEQTFNDDMSNYSDLDKIQYIANRNGCGSQSSNNPTEEIVSEKSIEELMKPITDDRDRNILRHLLEGNSKASASREFGLTESEVRASVDRIKREMIKFNTPKPLFAAKVCSICNQEKPLIAFGKNNRRKEGLQTFCKECNYQKNINI